MKKILTTLVAVSGYRRDDARDCEPGGRLVALWSGLGLGLAWLGLGRWCRSGRRRRGRSCGGRAVLLSWVHTIPTVHTAITAPAAGACGTATSGCAPATEACRLKGIAVRNASPHPVGGRLNLAHSVGVPFSNPPESARLMAMGDKFGGLGDFRSLTFGVGSRPITRGEHMHKSLIALAGAASISLASLAAPSPANAWCVGCAVGAGIIGGVAAGAIVGSAVANSAPYYPPIIRPGLLPAAARLLPAAPRLLPAAASASWRLLSACSRGACAGPPRLTLSWPRAAIGRSVRSGSKASVTDGEPCRSVPDFAVPDCVASKLNSAGRLA